MGRLMLLATFVGICGLLTYLWSWPIGLLGVAVSLTALIWFTRNSTTTGLFRASIKAYLWFRARGMTHDDALRGTVASRYPKSSEKREFVWLAFTAINTSRSTRDEATDIVDLVMEIFAFEQNLMKRRFRNVEDHREAVWHEYGTLTGAGTRTTSG